MQALKDQAFPAWGGPYGIAALNRIVNPVESQQFGDPGGNVLPELIFGRLEFLQQFGAPIDHDQDVFYILVIRVVFPSTFERFQFGSQEVRGPEYSYLQATWKWLCSGMSQAFDKPSVSVAQDFCGCGHDIHDHVVETKPAIDIILAGYFYVFCGEPFREAGPLNDTGQLDNQVDVLCVT
ncbi:hypothetical protein OP492_24340 [Pseudomonas mosselii]|nr:hypothetical protein [Pseudomonas mosselii]MEA3237790.1 hypothetical protein [Pseudomonas mosselii]UWS68041.1 hypothetical protein N0U38_04385 [Pseudomonas mosselii]